MLSADYFPHSVLLQKVTATLVGRVSVAVFPLVIFPTVTVTEWLCAGTVCVCAPSGLMVWVCPKQASFICPIKFPEVGLPSQGVAQVEGLFPENSPDSPAQLLKLSSKGIHMVELYEATAPVDPPWLCDPSEEVVSTAEFPAVPDPVCV